MAGVLHLWNEWGVQILVLVSFTLQVLLLSFAWMRRRSISRALWILLWFMYLLAEYTATYALGHMSITTSCKPAGKQQQQLMAFWAPFLLVHLGGQDTITAFAMEDSQLWLRHLLTFAVQALGAAYVLYKNMGSRGPLVVPAVLMFLVGVLKNAERVWALSFSRLEIIRRYLDGVSIKENDRDYSAAGAGVGAEAQLDDDESVLQGAHDLLYICLGQFVDDKIYPSRFQNNVMKHFHGNRKTFELVEMQLSLMYDIFYTKAAVIHTWYGRCVRVMSLLATVMAFSLLQFSIDGKDYYGYSTVDAAVTYILAVGALILEIASVLRAMGSTWTCATLKETEWDWLHNLHVSLRRCVKIVQARRWSSSIGQLNLLYCYCYIDDTTARLQLEGSSRFSPKKDKGGCIKQIGDKAASLGSKMVSFWRDGSSRISTGAKELVLEEIQRVVGACEGKEAVMMTYRGQCRLEQGCLKEDLTWSTSMEFDESILAWHLATDKFLTHSMSSKSNEGPSRSLVEATKAVSNYMMFLLVERPYMLPSPVRPTVHLQAKKVLREWPYSQFIMKRDSHNEGTIDEEAQALSPGAKLADQLLSMEESEKPGPNKLLWVVFGVWVEMLCYAAHHCSRESHARQLSSGGELITAVWLLTTAEFNRIYYSQENFKMRKHGSVWNFLNFVDSADFVKSIMTRRRPPPVGYYDARDRILTRTRRTPVK